MTARPDKRPSRTGSSDRRPARKPDNQPNARPDRRPNRDSRRPPATSEGDEGRPQARAGGESGGKFYQGAPTRKPRERTPLKTFEKVRGGKGASSGGRNHGKPSDRRPSDKVTDRLPQGKPEVIAEIKGVTFQDALKTLMAAIPGAATAVPPLGLNPVQPPPFKPRTQGPVSATAVPRSGANVAEPLADLPYTTELKLKSEAFRVFWKSQDLPDRPNLFIASPKPRKYRTTSKRRVTYVQGEAVFDFKPDGRTPGAARLGVASALEPEEHERLYTFILAKIRNEAYTALGRSLNFVVLRGDYKRFAVILNVHRTTAEVVRKAKMLAAQLQRETDLHVISVWLFQGAGDSPFYLDQSAPQGNWKAKRLVGPESFSIEVGEMQYDFHPLGFTQVNLSLVPTLIADTLEALKLRPDDRLLDLYCGYGLFSLAAAPQVSEVLGVDAAEKAIPAARTMAMARRFKHVRYIREIIGTRSLLKLLPPPGDRTEVMLLDPPKAGAGAGVIALLASRAPRRVVELFCGMEALVRDCDAWRRAGYMLAKAVPYDMFPGTDELEVMAVFVPDKFGLLNRIPEPLEKAVDKPYQPLRPNRPSKKAPRSSQGPRRN